MAKKYRYSGRKRKLTDDDVRAIRKAKREAGMTNTAIGDMFGVTPQHVGQILSGKVKAHVVDATGLEDLL